MAEKAGVAYLYLIICELCELCEQMYHLSIFSGKCLYFQETLRTRNSAKYKPPGNLIEAIALAATAKAAKAAKRRSGIQAANAAACCLSGARAPAYCLLAADIICRNLKDLLPFLHKVHTF